MTATGQRLRIVPVTSKRWTDLEELFGERGAYAGCWCMWFRQSGKEHQLLAGAGNRRNLKALVDEGRVPGLLAFLGDRAVGWCSVAPRDEFARVERSPILKRVDDRPAWSIVCFYIDRRFRGRGVGVALLRAAVRYAAGRGAKVIEGYPVDPGSARIANAGAYTGTVAMFRKAGFREVARHSPSRPIMRSFVRGARSARAPRRG